ncbi:hypothetical protein EMEDMD4_910060 [Sinorhizobium medicae]|uniref:Uncharacterized protein n=1 Tax=Sinorhizobium medicae TaxID=110321 RepID=A0A508X7U5_9HYPH|nr:hypothetical protein EMEDMD4_910060 [Sinorhizobium medicae]
MMRCLVVSAMRAEPPCSAPETVFTETPARSAMSFKETVTASPRVIDYPRVALTLRLSQIGAGPADMKELVFLGGSRSDCGFSGGSPKGSRGSVAQGSARF